MGDVNEVKLSTSAYNSIKAENQKANLLLDNMLTNSTLSADRSKIVFDSDAICLALEVLYSERYKKKLSALRTLASKGKI